MIGPISLIVGTPYKLNVPTDATRVVIDNDSPYDVWFSFTLTAPPVVTPSSGQWQGIMRRGHTGMVPIFGRPVASQREQTLNAIGAFQGVMWLLAVNPGGLASSGTVSVRSSVYITPLTPFDADPVYSALSTQTDLSSQPRVVSVPIASTQNFSGRDAVSVSVLNKWAVAQPTAAQLAAQSAVLYIYHAIFTLAALPVNAVCGCSLNLECYPGDAGFNPIAGFTPIVIYIADLYAAQNTTAFTVTQAHQVFTPPAPKANIILWNGLGTPANLCLRLNCIAASSTSGNFPQLAFNVGADIDTTNTQSIPGTIGNGTFNLFGSGAGDPNIF